MFAITATSYRAIAGADQLQPGEEAVEALPQSLLVALAQAEARLRRDELLLSSDWTQLPDTGLSQAKRDGWIQYRQALRDLPAGPDWLTTGWPVAPV